jgi:hypothetical protein
VFWLENRIPNPPNWFLPWGKLLWSGYPHTWTPMNTPYSWTYASDHSDPG